MNPELLSTFFGWLTIVNFAILALALDLVWGYCGILSLGHGAFFALGGYAMGMYLMRQIGARGVYGNPELPDFMVFLNWQELPWFWYGFDMFWFAAIMIVAVPGLLAFVFGWFAFRSRVTGVYLSIITQAMTYALLLAFFRNEMGFGGNNGLTDFKDILGFNIQAQERVVFGTPAAEAVVTEAEHFGEEQGNAAILRFIATHQDADGVEFRRVTVDHLGLVEVADRSQYFGRRTNRCLRLTLTQMISRS